MTAPGCIDRPTAAADASVSGAQAQAGASPVRRTLRELVRYFVASAIALAVDTGLYALGLRLHLGYPLAAIVGFLGGLAVAYLISVSWAFTTRRLGDARMEFIVFAAIGVVGLLLTESLLWLQIDVLAFGPLPAKLAASCGVFFFNFGARKLVLFKTHPTGRALATS
jgi:putative flippase GtrA